MNYKYYDQHSLNAANKPELIEIFRETFTDSEGPEEGELIAGLVKDMLEEQDNNSVHIYVCEDGKRIVAGAIFSRFIFKGQNVNAYIIAPVAVHTDYQRRGIGQKLISFAHEDLRDRSVDLLITYGDIKYYSKVGYTQISEDIIKPPLKLLYPEGWLAQSLSGEEVRQIPGDTYCVDALNDQKYW